jgi:hypothetical protein
MRSSIRSCRHQTMLDLCFRGEKQAAEAS